MSYEIFNPKIDKPHHEASREEAQDAHNWFIENIPIRLSQLKVLVQQDGVNLDFKVKSLSQLHRWFVSVAMDESIITDECDSIQPSSFLFSLCNDIGMYISEMIIKGRDGVKWDFYTKNKNDIYYQRSVLNGFKVKNENFHVDIDYLLCQYAYRLVRNSEEKRTYFLQCTKGHL